MILHTFGIVGLTNGQFPAVEKDKLVEEFHGHIHQIVGLSGGTL